LVFKILQKGFKECDKFAETRWGIQISVAVAITDVFRKNGINVSNKVVRILKIFTKIYDIKNRRVIYGT